MAIRPVFYVYDKQVIKRDIEFTWYPGFAISQKQKSIDDLHSKIKLQLGCKSQDVLEISTKSSNKLGVNLSAFNLRLTINKTCSTTESYFQSSKVFEYGGPYKDILNMSPFDAKKDVRLRSSGRLIKFELNDEKWSKEPKTLFYDWLYINAVYQNKQLHNEIIKYNYFTDIEFNPKKSMNCQAKSAALYVSLYKSGLLEVVIRDKEKYLDMFSKDDFVQLALI